ncbi:MAG: DNA polymerase III subunit gamma/tau [Methylobacterium sp.]|nr:DNA polymerase III subunit gamma/tau [Methylobacterium sp.]MCA3651115.1 DNA polymerase III subunit gamma/tau [Methylobacterium sp.]
MANSDLPISDLPGSEHGGAYRVLARKYRPQSFEDLIGQGAMVRTLRNSFSTNRIHQAYIFTGVRGVGKTTTARILARALNYETESVKTPQIDMPTLGLHCEAIMESRHVDVIEMDAASNTSISNIREIIEAARYKPVSARTKVYIIDEVHMLSTAAFNGLLKTLEEPPPHVKFLFATTEIRKVPVTVLSRCQRFDLRRIEAEEMIDYLAGIAGKERVQIEREALGLIARASEGSMRDALSLMDQAIAHGGGKVEAEAVRASLGLADRSRIIDLFEAVMKGDIARALTEFESQYDSGADPVAILTDLAEFVHIVTRLKLTPESRKDAALSPGERERGAAFAAALTIRPLTMAWQILLKGLQEVQSASRPKIAAEMVLIRLAYAADLPGPAEIIRDLRNGNIGAPPGGGMPAGGAVAAPRASAPAMGEPGAPRMVAGGGAMQRPAMQRPAMRAEAQAIPSNLPQSFEAVAALAEAKRDIRLQLALTRDVRLMRFEPGRIEFILEPHGEADLPNRLLRALLDWTGHRWGVTVVDAPAGPLPPTLHEIAEEKRAEERRGVQNKPAIQAVLKHFPGAEIVQIEEARATPAAEAAPNETDEPPDFTDLEFSDDDL